MSDPPETMPSLGCTQCSHLAVWPFQLDHHIRRNHKNTAATKLFYDTEEPELYLCFCYDFKSNNKLGLYEHWANTHRTGRFEDDSFGSVSNGEFQSYTCDSCHYKGYSALSIVKHSCELVPKVVKVIIAGSSVKQLEKDKKEHLPIPSDQVERFCCTDCSYRSNQKRNLDKHMLTHAVAGEIDRYVCTECFHQFKQMRGLKLHMLTHAAGDSVRLFSCFKCSYRTTIRGNLTKHMRGRHNIPTATTIMQTVPACDKMKWHDCSKCSYRSKQKAHMNRHVLVMHTAPEKIEWFNCTECSYRAKLKNDLQKHVMRIHAESEEINWFCCDKCSYRGKQKVNLQEHMLNHTANDEIKWFRCMKCEYRSKRKAVLTEHMYRWHSMRTHPSTDGIDWLNCMKCSYRTRLKVKLDRHMRTHAGRVARSNGADFHRSKLVGDLSKKPVVSRVTSMVAVVTKEQNETESGFADGTNTEQKRIKLERNELHEAKETAEGTIFRKKGFTLIRRSVNAMCELLKDNNRGNNK